MSTTHIRVGTHTKTGHPRPKPLVMVASSLRQLNLIFPSLEPHSSHLCPRNLIPFVSPSLEPHGSLIRTSFPSPLSSKPQLLSSLGHWHFITPSLEHHLCHLITFVSPSLEPHLSLIPSPLSSEHHSLRLSVIGSSSVRHRNLIPFVSPSLEPHFSLIPLTSVIRTSFLSSLRHWNLTTASLEPQFHVTGTSSRIPASLRHWNLITTPPSPHHPPPPTCEIPLPPPITVTGLSLRRLPSGGRLCPIVDHSATCLQAIGTQGAIDLTSPLALPYRPDPPPSPPPPILV